MKLRTKFFAALVTLVLFMAGAFFAVSAGYTENLFRQYATTAQRGNAEQWAQWLSYFYQANGGSWKGVNNFVLFQLQQTGNRNNWYQTITVLDENNNTVLTIQSQDQDSEPSVQLQVPINVGERKVGTLQLRTPTSRGLYQVEQTVLHSMTVATVGSTVAAAIVALLIGAWLTRRITRPLQSMAGAMRKITDGNLETRLSMTSKDEFGQVADAFNDMIQRLDRTEKARRHLVADVAHELRTPLTIMQGQLELIQQGLKAAEPSTLLPIQDEVVRLTNLVQDLHQLSLAEVGKLSLEMEETEIVKLADRVVENFQIEAEDKEIDLTFESTVPTEFRMAADRNRMTQVLVNLVGNALRYTSDGGMVSVTITRGADLVKISVSDTGPGIAEEHLPHVFDRFYRAEEDRSRASGGTGLGLAIAKEFVEAHDGRIEVESTVGQGTTFIVLLPISTKNP